MSIRDSLNQQDRIEAALGDCSKEELIRICANLMKTYVLDGITPNKPDVGKVHVPTHLRDLSFPVLIETLKFHLDLPDLEKLVVADGQVFVKLGEREYPLDGPAPASTPPVRPAASPSQAGPSQAGPTQPAPRPAAPAAAQPRPAAPAATPPRTERAQPSSPKPADDRFRMLELD